MSRFWSGVCRWESASEWNKINNHLIRTGVIKSFAPQLESVVSSTTTIGHSSLMFVWAEVRGRQVGNCRRNIISNHLLDIIVKKCFSPQLKSAVYFTAWFTRVHCMVFLACLGVFYNRLKFFPGVSKHPVCLSYINKCKCYMQFCKNNY